MRFLIEYTIDDDHKSIEVEAVDLETVKTAINQWRVENLCQNDTKIEIVKLTLLN